MEEKLLIKMVELFFEISFEADEKIRKTVMQLEKLSDKNLKIIMGEELTEFHKAQIIERIEEIKTFWEKKIKRILEIKTKLEGKENKEELGEKKND